MGNEETEVVRKSCVECSTVSPPGNTEYELIRQGWRLTRAAEPAGGKKMEWRCPACFAHHRSKAPAR